MYYSSRRLVIVLAVALAVALCLNLACVAAEDAGGGSSAGGGSDATDTPSVSQLLKEGTAALTTGRMGEAIAKFDAAIAAEPGNYLSYYRRATAYLSSGRTASALADLDKLLTLNPRFAQAHLQKGKTFAKDGDLDAAKKSIKEYLKLKKGDEEATTLSNSIDAALSNLKSLKSAHEYLEKSVKKGHDASSDSSVAARADDCLRYASQVLEVSPSLLEARRLRADCYLAKGDVENAVGDWTRIAHLAPSTDLYLRLSSLSYFIFGDRDSQYRDAGLSHLKTCLGSDPDNRRCAKAHRRIKNFNKALQKAQNFQEGGSWRAVIGSLKGPKVGQPSIYQQIEGAIKEDVEAGVLPGGLKEPLKQSALLHELNEMHCQAHLELDELKKAMPYCEKASEREPDNLHGLVAKAEEHLAAERYEEAVRDLSRAFEQSGKTNRSIHARLQKAQQRLKISKTKDYYKVLGVSRDADEQTIKKAYRKMAREHHPDKGGKPEKMAEINEAFGVLNDAELKARFDQGDDPNDPMGGHQGGYGNPFSQGAAGGHPFAQFFQQGGPGGDGSQFFFQQGGGGGGGGRRMHFQWG